MGKMFDILVIGELNVDLILNNIEQQLEIGKEVIANSMVVTLGSSSAIFASNVSTMGAKVAFLGKIGQDRFGDDVIHLLRKKQVDTRSILRASQYGTGATVVLNYPQDRYMITYPGAMDHLSINEVSTKVLDSASHLHFSSPFLQTGIKDDLGVLFKQAKELGLTTSLDPQWDPLQRWELDFESLLPYVDVFLPNIHELRAITGFQDIQTAAERFAGLCKYMVVKCGEEGAIAFSHEDQLHGMPFRNKSVVDTVGAGDSFDAGFVRMFTLGKPLKDCLDFANLMGAINTTEVGGTGAFKNTDYIKQIARKKFNSLI